MRIAVISAHTSPLARPGGNKAGGLNVYVRGLAGQLAQRGHQVDIFSRATHAGTPEVTQVMPGLRVINLRAGPRRYLTPASIYKHLAAFQAALADFVARDAIPDCRPYDLVHSHYWLSGLVGQHLKATWGIPHVTMFHTLGEVKNRASVAEHESDLRIDSERSIVHSADRVICATEAEARLLRQLYGAGEAKVAVIPLGVDLERFRPADKHAAREALGIESQNVILFVGRIEPLKGVDILIDAAALLDKDIDCSVVIVGGDEASSAQAKRLQALARARGIEQRIIFAGAVEHELLPLYYNAADICVVPSHYESFGLVAVEAMASGVPVVASRVGGLAQTVKDGETGYLIQWLCPEPFAERIELLLDNEPLRLNLGESAVNAVDRYRWEKVTDEVAQLYREVALGRLDPTSAVSESV